MEDNSNILFLLAANQCLLNVGAYLYVLTERGKIIKKRYSAKWLLSRQTEGFSHKLLKELEDEDTRLFRKVLRVTPLQFQGILEKISPIIKKKDTCFRPAISPAERLQVTLVYLATGATQTFLQFPFRIQQSTISKIIKGTVAAIYDTFKDDYLKFPQSEQDWLKISREFFDLWGFPNCIGAIDGKHCKIKPLKSFGSNYWCYKGFHSFILMAICDARYRFIYVDVGVNGRIGDACLWLNSDLKHAIEAQTVAIPPPANLPMTTTATPYTLISDDAFPLTEYMLKPYSHLTLTEDEIRFNRILSRNRRVVENAFGILANRFQVLFTPIFRDPHEAIKIVLASVCLHNFLRTENIQANTVCDNFSENEINSIVATNYDDYTCQTRAAFRGRSNIKAQKLRKTIEEYFKVFKDKFNCN